MPAGRRSGVDGEQRRAQIVTAAQHAIATLGFEGFRVRDVAAQVGINIATLHYHFPTKEALIAAVVQQIVGNLDRVPYDPSADPRQVLTDHLGHILGRFDTEREQFLVLNELYARGGRDPELRTILVANDEAWADYLRPVFVAGRDQGRFRADLDPDAATALVIGFLKSLLFQYDLTPDRIQRTAAEILRAVEA
ncbi:TetR/AcrR family transcriptional regulator [Actinoplanes bogorensis]|uniref:TetR/AcrR family transcriptional regulator n=1 Tax=Paractinoplanes bogorensis TaxID=1610840 RepID=A0ABS5YKQ1_9ACTN|nr:TetR/AcrR family transcriptional regulator [Actinoplanes bogorensis]MBU2664048.1 TetR/AcrR family transcriptional regulator [Actinoplanes bogorensis]